MALAIDASSPAIAVQNVTSTSTVTTASFTPPSGSRLYIRWAWNSNVGDSPTAPSITDSLGAHLTYTLLDHRTKADSPAVTGQAAHWSAVGSGSAMTVTVTANGTTIHCGALQVLVFTDTGTPGVGAHGKGGQTTNAAISQSYTAQGTGSMGLIAVQDWDVASHAAGTGMTATDGGTGAPGDVGGGISYAFWRRASFDGSVGVTNTVADTITGTTANVCWVYAEIAPSVVASSWTYGFDVRIGG